MLTIHTLNTTSSNALKNDFFRCSDTAVAIPSTYLNDDYCDCADGSDELKSSACSSAGNVLYSSRFQCTNDGYEEQFIFFSRVGDGVCDCCDGSDEAPRVCENTCAVRAQQQKEAFARRVAGWRKGLATQNQRLIQAQTLVAERNKKLALSQEHIVRLKLALPGLEAVVAAEEQLEQEERVAVDRRLEETLKVTLRLSELPAFTLSSDVVPHAALSCFESGVEAAIELAGGNSAGVEDDVGLLLVGVAARGKDDMSQHKREIEEGLRLRTVEREQLAKWALKLADHCGNGSCHADNPSRSHSLTHSLTPTLTPSHSNS